MPKDYHVREKFICITFGKHAHSQFVSIYGVAVVLCMFSYMKLSYQAFRDEVHLFVYRGA